jgi:hypothetical protein
MQKPQKDYKQLKLQIKGNFKKFWAKLFLRKRIKSMGVEVQDIKDLSSEHVEIVVSGNKEQLWEVINWSKGQDIFLVLNEVIFEFVDAAKPA